MTYMDPSSPVDGAIIYWRIISGTQSSTFALNDERDAGRLGLEPGHVEFRLTETVVWQVRLTGRTQGAERTLRDVGLA